MIQNPILLINESCNVSLRYKVFGELSCFLMAPINHKIFFLYSFYKY